MTLRLDDAPWGGASWSAKKSPSEKKTFFPAQLRVLPDFLASFGHCAR
jgi:hypothetical protein